MTTDNDMTEMEMMAAGMDDAEIVDRLFSREITAGEITDGHIMGSTFGVPYGDGQIGIYGGMLTLEFDKVATKVLIAAARRARSGGLTDPMKAALSEAAGKFIEALFEAGNGVRIL